MKSQCAWGMCLGPFNDARRRYNVNEKKTKLPTKTRLYTACIFRLSGTDFTSHCQGIMIIVYYYYYAKVMFAPLLQ